jgi:hypothetical protein
MSAATAMNLGIRIAVHEKCYPAKKKIIVTASMATDISMAVRERTDDEDVVKARHHTWSEDEEDNSEDSPDALKLVLSWKKHTQNSRKLSELE